MKSTIFIICLSLFKSIKSEWKFPTFYNLSEVPSSEYPLEAFIEYIDSDYLQLNIETNSKAFLTFSFLNTTKNSILKYSNEPFSRKTRFEEEYKRNSSQKISRLGPQHCPMAGNISKAFIQKK